MGHRATQSELRCSCRRRAALPPPHCDGAAARRAARAGLRRWASRISLGAQFTSANIQRMRWRQSKESQNVEDYRGRSTGGGGGLKIGLGTVVIGVIAYFL